MIEFPKPGDEQLNNLAYWYPVLREINMRVPRTLIVHRGDCDLRQLLDGKSPEGWNNFHFDLAWACGRVGYPCFLRTGMTSHKHDWKNTCYVASRDDLRAPERVYRLVEFSEMANFVGPPLNYDFWCVREMIPTEPVITAFHGGMPVAYEVRGFIRDGDVRCVHPYWPRDVFADEPEEVRAKAAELDRVPDEGDEVYEMLRYIAKHFGGYWSVDMLRDKDGRWWCTDMATGDRSYHYAGCEHKEKT